MELTQEQLLSIARSYFRDCLIEGNMSVFWTESLMGNIDEADWADTYAHAKEKEANLRQLDKKGLAAKHFESAVRSKLKDSEFSDKNVGGESIEILQGYFVRAALEGCRILQAKLERNYPATAPIDPLFLGIMDDTLPEMPEWDLVQHGKVPPLAELIKKFKGAHPSWVYKTEQDYKRVLGLLVEHFGSEHNVKSIQTKDIGEFRDLLLKIPKNYSKLKKHNHLSTKQAIEALKDEPTISPKTADKYLGLTRSFLNWCESEGYIDKVPGQKIAIDYKSDIKARLPFTQAELKALFASPIWTGCHSQTRRSKPGSQIHKNAYYWIPLLAAYTGMRSGEIIQLQHGDILTENGIPYIDINDEHQKKIKTKFSRRRIPIHPCLKEWGFLDFIAERATKQSHKRIFHEITISPQGDPSNAFSKFFARYLKDIGLKNNKLTFHSFRHGVPDALDAKGVPEAHKHAIMGHADASASAHYGIGAPIAVLLDSISKISYDFESEFDTAPASAKATTEGMSS